MKIPRQAKWWRYASLAAVLFFVVCSAHAQETVFDVPSADFLDKGNVYGELDGTLRPIDLVSIYTPRVMVGIGHGIEVGMNFDGMGLPRTEEIDVSPTMKWRLWRRESSG